MKERIGRLGRERRVRGLVLLITALLAVNLGLLATRGDATPKPAPPKPVVEDPPAPPTTQKARPEPVRLPVPIDPPANPYALEPEIRLGTIEIPRIGLVHDLYQGISLLSINRGPSHWPGSALPGGVGNVVVAGHRVTHSRPFRNIDQLQPGDEVVFNVEGGRFVYEMTRNEIVTPEGMHVVEQTPARTATLFACHPPGSARYRYVVHLALKTAPDAVRAP